MIHLSIEGIQEAQDANLRDIAAMGPSGALGEAVRFVTVGLHRHALIVTHVDTGALRGSHRMLIDGGRAEIYIDPGSVNPKGGRPAVYGPIEHERGGEHAFYDRAMYEAGPGLISRAVGMILGGIA